LRDSRKELQVRQFLGAPSQKGEGATKKLPLCERRSRAAKKSTSPSHFIPLHAAGCFCGSLNGSLFTIAVIILWIVGESA